MHSVEQVTPHQAVAAATEHIESGTSHHDEMHTVAVAVKETLEQGLALGVLVELIQNDTGGFVLRRSSWSVAARTAGPRSICRRSSALSQLRYLLLMDRQAVVLPTWHFTTVSKLVLDFRTQLTRSSHRVM